MLINSYKNIDLNKILGDQIYPDEKIIYVANTHWSALVYSLFLLIFPVASIILDGLKSLFIQPIGFWMMLLFSITGLFLYLNLKIILTNKRYIVSIVKSQKRKGLLFREIIRVKSSQDIFGCGRFYVETSKNPGKFTKMSMINNPKKLENKINEQLELTKQDDKEEFIQGENIKNQSSSQLWWTIVVSFTILQIFLIYTGFVLASKIIPVFFVIYLSFNKFFKNAHKP